MRIQDLSESIRKHWAVAIAVCILVVPSVWLAMDYLYRCRLDEKDAKIRILEGKTRFSKTDNGVEPQQMRSESIPPPAVASYKIPGRRSIEGKLGSSADSSSGWLDLFAVTDFGAGDRLRLRIGGTAERIVVRLLPKASSPDDPVGIVGTSVIVPQDRIVEIAVQEDRKSIVQISVHGGPRPWNKFSLGSGNGAATLEGGEILR